VRPVERKQRLIGSQLGQIHPHKRYPWTVPPASVRAGISHRPSSSDGTKGPVARRWQPKPPRIRGGPYRTLGCCTWQPHPRRRGRHLGCPSQVAGLVSRAALDAGRQSSDRTARRAASAGRVKSIRTCAGCTRPSPPGRTARGPPCNEPGASRGGRDEVTEEVRASSSRQAEDQEDGVKSDQPRLVVWEIQTPTTRSSHVLPQRMCD